MEKIARKVSETNFDWFYDHILRVLCEEIHGYFGKKTIEEFLGFGIFGQIYEGIS